MKKSLLRVIICVSVSPFCVAQTARPPMHSVRVLTAAERDTLRNQASAAFDLVWRAGCPLRNDEPLSEWRTCLTSAVKTAEDNYKIYVSAVRDLLLSPKPEEAGDSGMQRWFGDNRRDFDAANRAWFAYYAAQCKSETSIVEPGSGMAETQSNCQLAMLKDRARRIIDIYGPIIQIGIGTSKGHGQ